MTIDLSEDLRRRSWRERAPGYANVGAFACQQRARLILTTSHWAACCGRGARDER
jgi:hypothetical protein